MNTRLLTIGDHFSAADADRVLFGLDLQAVLVNTRQLDNRDEVVALLEDVDWWKAALAAVPRPIQSLAIRASSARWRANNASNGSL
jgi:hypothetical protein